MASRSQSWRMKTLSGSSVGRLVNESRNRLESEDSSSIFLHHPRAAVLKVLHQEILLNIVDGKPLPNFFVYSRPWYRDGAMMAMVLKRTGNLHLIKDWIVGLREPFDRNNSGEREADNLGEALYLMSLGSDRSHPLLPVVLEQLKHFEKDRHIEGRSDFALHPVYQTRWARLGLTSLGLPCSYAAPMVEDSYARLCWWDRPRADARSDRKRHQHGLSVPDLGPVPFRAPRRRPDDRPGLSPFLGGQGRARRTMRA